MINWINSLNFIYSSLPDGSELLLNQTFQIAIDYVNWTGFSSKIVPQHFSKRQLSCLNNDIQLIHFRNI